MTIFPPRLSQPIVKRSMSMLAGLTGAMTSTPTDPSQFSSRPYFPSKPDGPFPYSSQDLTPTEHGNDGSFYSVPRFVTHIDDNAIATVRKYYAEELPTKGSILDFCSSWVSHYPPKIEEAAKKGDVTVLGTGMNESELSKNAILKAYSVQDLNQDPDIRIPTTKDGKNVTEALDASTCVVSIDYLTKPVEVLSSLRKVTSNGGKVHLVISNRCFPTKVVGRWLKIDENKRLEMVGDYLWWSDWRNIEILTLVEGTWTKDPLWVVRGTKQEV